MNAQKLIIAAILATTGLGVANAAEPAKTRTEVINELKQARASGELGQHLDFVFFDQQTAGSKTRAEVAAELKQAKQQGLLAVGDASYPALPVATTSRVRSEVKAEAVAARKSSGSDRDYNYGG